MRCTPLESWVLHKIGGSAPLTRSALQAYQLQTLRQTLQLVYNNSSFYREHLAGCPVRPDSLAELAALPFTTAEQLSRFPQRFVCVSQSDISRVVTLQTSGTTAVPKRLFFTPEDQQLTVDFFHIGMSQLAAAPDTVLILLPGQTPGSVGDLLAEGLRRLGARPLKHGPVKDAAGVLQLINQEKVDCLVGTPMQVLQIERTRQLMDAPPLKMKSMLLTTDSVSPAVCRVMQQAWGAEVFNHYGMTEMGLGGGVECAAHRGYHLREADLLVEIVDPHNGLPLPDGEYGELVFTTLTRRGMPLIRYRSGDLTRFIPGPCPCGTQLKTLEVVRDRISGLHALDEDTLSISRLDDALLPLDGLLDYTAVLHTARRPRRLALCVEMPGCSTQEAQEAVRHALDALPLLRRAQTAGELEVSVETGVLEKGSMVKRRISLVASD